MDFNKEKQRFLEDFNIWQTVVIQLDDWSNYRTKLLSEPWNLCWTLVAKFDWLGAYDIERCFLDDWD